MYINKVKILVLFALTSQVVESAKSYISNALSNNIHSQQSTQYSLSPQAFYVPQDYQKYVPVLSQKYVPAAENQIPVVVSSTEKALLSPAYKNSVVASKYVPVIKTTQSPLSNQGPYLYTLAKAVPSSTVAYSSLGGIENNYESNFPKKYQYGYRVSDAHTGTEFGHSEVNDGHAAKGYYHVLLPDGRLQNVKYWAGPSGYHATITYESKY